MANCISINENSNIFIWVNIVCNLNLMSGFLDIFVKHIQKMLIEGIFA